MTSTSQHRCVFVGNIPYDATEEQLVQICEEVGPVVSFRLVLDRETGKPKGYGFCEYKDEETALSARRNLHGYEINGRQLRVDFAENDKSADRNREQGRGGPGLASNAVADNRISSGPTTSGSVAPHQSIGIQLSSTAASVMAGALGGGQSQHGSESDRLTQYLAQMSKNQLAELMSEVKALSIQNKALAYKLLQNNPQFCKALFQAQIMLGMVAPQILQMVHTKQSSSSKFLSQKHDNQLATASHNALPPALPNVTQIGTSLRTQEAPPSTLPLNPLDQQHIPIQSRFQPLQETQSQLLLQGIVQGKPGYLTTPSAQTLTLTNRSLPPAVPSTLSSGLVTPLSQQPRISVMQNVDQHSQLSFPNSSVQQTALQQPLSQVGSQNYTPTLNMPLETSREGGGMSGPHSGTTIQGLRVDMPPISVMQSMQPANAEKLMFDSVNRPSKLSRLEDGSRAPIITSSHGSAVASVPPQDFTTGLPSSSSTGHVAVSDDRTLDGDANLSQFLPEAEAALLKQVMSLTAEQLNSLPPEQRQQVIQLQQMLKS